MIIRNIVILNYRVNRFGSRNTFRIFEGRQNEIVVKELSVATANVSETFRFKSTYIMPSHGSDGNGLNREDGHIAYHELYTVAYTSTPMAFQNANLSPNYWGALFSICKNLIVFCQHLSIKNTGVACLVTNFLTSIAQPKPRTLSTIDVPPADEILCQMP